MVKFDRYFLYVQSVVWCTSGILSRPTSFHYVHEWHRQSYKIVTYADGIILFDRVISGSNQNVKDPFPISYTGVCLNEMELNSFVCCDVFYTWLLTEGEHNFEKGWYGVGDLGYYVPYYAPFTAFGSYDCKRQLSLGLHFQIMQDL